MGVTTGVSVDEYLSSVYEPDCDYLDGEVVDRNVGEFDHSTVQCILIGALLRAAPDLELRVKPELRMRLKSSRYRVPDILVIRATQQFEPVLTSPPLLCIEIVSPEDRLSRITEKVKDYLAFGVDYVWVIDPETETAWQHTSNSSTEVRDQLTTNETNLTILLPDLFTRLAKSRKRTL